MAPQLPWTTEMIDVLLNLVILKGIHVSSRTEVKSKWCELNEDIYLNGCFAPFKSIYYKKGEYRNLREKYLKVKAAITEDMASGNKSKYSGELSQQYSLVEQICHEIDEDRELKNSRKGVAAELETVLKDTEDKILRRKEYGKRKSIDGVIVDYSEGKRKPSGSSIDDAIVNISETMKTRYSSSTNEREVERKILDWIRTEGKGPEDLLKDSNISLAYESYLDTFDLLNSVGIETLVSIYCSRGKSFEREQFQNSMRELYFKPIEFHKLYVGLTSWHFQAEDKYSKKVTPVPMEPLQEEEAEAND